MYKQNYSERVKDTQKKQFIKRKLDCSENGTKMVKYKKVEDNLNDNSCEALQIPGNSDYSRQQIDVTKATELFHIRTLVLGQNIFAPVVTNYGIDHLSLSAMFLYINLVQKKSLIYVLLV